MCVKQSALCWWRYSNNTHTVIYIEKLKTNILYNSPSLPVRPAAVVIHGDRYEGDDSLSSQPIRKHHLLTYINV